MKTNVSPRTARRSPRNRAGVGRCAPTALWLAVAVAAAIGCTAPPLAEKEPLAVSPVRMGANEQRVVENVIVVTDASGTMYGEGTFPEAKALSESFVAALPERTERASSKSYNAGSIGFGGDERVELPLEGFDRKALGGAVERVEVMGAIDGYGGTTPFHAVLDEIASELEGKHGRTAVVIFSDGEPDDEGRALSETQALVDGYRDGVCFHTVQTGNDPEGERFLRTLAELTSPCGSYRQAGTVETADALAAFTRGVMVGNAPSQRALPAVAANACDGMTLHGVEFAFDSADLVGNSPQVLDRAAAQLQQCKNVQVSVEGHTDPRGSASYNQKLSERRANAVREYLIRDGVSADRITAVGKGESQPIDTSNTEEGYQRDRRVELVPR